MKRFFSLFTPPRKRMRAEVASLMRLTRDGGGPNLNPIMNVVRNIDPLSFNIKQNGYELARRLAAALPPRAVAGPYPVGLRCQASTQMDMESDWVAYWCAQIQVALMFHRKLWELSYILQGIWEHGHLAPGKRGLGFGCGTEVIPSYLASRGVAVTVTDLPSADARSAGWASTNQLTGSLDAAFHAHVVDRAQFEALASYRNVDMNEIPADLRDYDFCWSTCALEHVGSIAKAMAFVHASLDTLKPGGLAIHTTELNINPDGPTIDHWPTVLFQRSHLEALAASLTAAGHDVAPLDFTLGAQPMDRFVDLPPYHHELAPELQTWLGEPIHLKTTIDGFVATCFGLIVRKRGS